VADRHPRPRRLRRRRRVHPDRQPPLPRLRAPAPGARAARLPAASAAAAPQGGSRAGAPAPACTTSRPTCRGSSPRSPGTWPTLRRARATRCCCGRRCGWATTRWRRAGQGVRVGGAAGRRDRALRPVAMRLHRSRGPANHRLRPVRAALPHSVSGRRGPEPGRGLAAGARWSGRGLTDPREAEQAAGRSAPMNPGRPVPVRSPLRSRARPPVQRAITRGDGPDRNPPPPLRACP
jgi:hypothetical protein